MLRRALLSLCLLIPSALQAQYVSGSVVVLEDAGDYIAIAADSLRIGPAAGQISFDACKIASLNDQFVFGETGISSKSPAGEAPLGGEWSALEIARQEYAAQLKSRSTHLIQDEAEAYGRRLAAQFNRDLKLDSSGSLRSYLAASGGSVPPSSPVLTHSVNEW